MEYRDQGISTLCAAPYYVVSNMSKIRRPSWTTPTATTYAKSVLAQLGTTTFTYGYWAHDLVAFGLRSTITLMLLCLCYNIILLIVFLLHLINLLETIHHSSAPLIVCFASNYIYVYVWDGGE